MSSAAKGSGPLSLEIKSAELPLVAVLLKSTQLDLVAQELEHRFGDTPDFFDRDAVLIDLSAVADQADSPDWIALLALLRRYRLSPVAVKGGNPVQMQAAFDQGLAPAEEAHWQKTALTQNKAGDKLPPPTKAAHPELQPALILTKPLRSGQQVYARGRDLVVMAMVNAGAEVIADGHIHVYAPLRGRVIAGARGFTDARIFANSLEAELISIAGIYRTSDVPLPEAVRGKPAQVHLHSSPDGDKLIIEPIL